MKWLAEWPLLVLALFVDEPYREQLIAGQTILCSLYPNTHNFHAATAVFVLFYFTHPYTHTQLIHATVLQHIIVACAVASHYVVPKYNRSIWLLSAWSLRWLATASIFDTPIRTCIKCALFACVSQGPWRSACGIKWVWLLFTHEVAWFLLPIQILYEVYSGKKTNPLDIV